MEPDDLLCSRNARPPKALVGRAQWKINQPPSLERERASLDGSIRSMVLAWDKSVSRRARGWAGEKVARSKGQPRPLPLREVERIAGAMLDKLIIESVVRTLQ
jgi:hypothetical protein